jgi:hypothetical protein
MFIFGSVNEGNVRENKGSNEPRIQQKSSLTRDPLSIKFLTSTHYKVVTDKAILHINFKEPAIINNYKSKATHQMQK